MLTNAAIGGVAVALYLTVLALQLNPHYSLTGMPSLFLTMTASYGLNVAVVFYAFIVLQQVVASEPISPGWISFRVLVWLCSMGSIAGAWLMWINLRGFGPMLDPSTSLRMAAGAVALTLAAAMMVMLGIWNFWTDRRRSRIAAGLLGAVLAASFAVPMTFRGPGTEPPQPAPRAPAAADGAEDPGRTRVTLLLFEGASVDFIAPAAADGRLPNFRRLLDTGAFMHMATTRPTQPSPVWTAAATGKLPAANGIRSAATYWPISSSDGLEMLPDSCFSHALVRFGFLRQQVHTSADLRARPIWDILGQLGVTVGVVNWSLTHPAGAVRGYEVTDEFDRLARQTAVDIENSQSVWPRAAGPVAVAAAASPVREPWMTQSTTNTEIGELIARTCRSDGAYEQIALALERQYPSRFQAVRYKCLDAAGHYLLRFTSPNPFGDVSDEDVQRYSVALGAFYASADAALGRALAGLRPGDLLIVMSGFGMDPLDVGKRLLERVMGNPVPSGTHERAPDGFMLVVGSDVKPGRYPRASIVDLAPTVLYFLGLPVGRDMDGFARTDLFVKAFLDRRPITYIPTYERPPAQ